jgi:(2Fe-2S) ferredoxin
MLKLDKRSLEAFKPTKTINRDEYIKIGMSTCGQAAGADVIYRTFVEETQKRHLTVPIQKCGCNGMCYAEPLVEVKINGLPTVTYGKVTKDIAVRIIEKHVVEKLLLNECIYDSLYQEIK